MNNQTKNKRIITLQDISCFGSCSATVALPLLAARGIETAILPSAILSTHTGGFTTPFVLDLTDQMNCIVNHWKREGLLFDAIYTGYIGDARQFEIIDNLRELLKKDGKLIVDPAMADHGRLYKGLGPEIVEGMKGLVRKADLILPNLTEAALLLEQPFKEDCSEEELRDMCRRLSDLGPETVIITGTSLACDQIGSSSYNRREDRFLSCMGKKMLRSFHGTGDMFASIITAGYVTGKDLYETQKEACDFIVHCIENTMDDPNHSYGVIMDRTV